MYTVRIKKSENADTRSAKGEITKEQLLFATKSHIDDVQRIGFAISQMLNDNLAKHDYTKLSGIDQFYEDFTSGRQGDDFKKLPWYQTHLTERHHLNDRCPDDVNLIDILESIIDSVAAGMARSGDVYPIKFDNDILEKAVENTKNLIQNNIEILDIEGGK